MIAHFTEEHRYLSNFFIEPDGSTVEHEFQAAKTRDLFEKLEILRAPTPRDAKRLGRNVALRPHWDDLRIGEMSSLVLRKFFDHPGLAKALLATGDQQLVEGNHWHDNFWGKCHCHRCENFSLVGHNHLGLILMDVRAVLLG